MSSLISVSNSFQERNIIQMDIEELKKIINGPLGDLVITDEEFDEAAKLVQAINNVTDDNRLQLYGLYKQVTVGDVNTARPWGIDFVGCAKWYVHLCLQVE